MKEKIKLYILSGFLGAGKTTFLKKMLDFFAGKKLGVLVNEFGAINVDGKTINKNGIEYMEINDGSIFCSCLKADFVKALIALQKEDINILIIENSGLADPSTMNRLLSEMEKQMERGYAYQGSICLVDCTSFLEYLDVLCAIENQILSSNTIIINKTDLVAHETVDKVKETILSINSKAVTIPAVQAEVSMAFLNKSLSNNGYDGETSNQPCTRPETYALTCGGIYSKEAIVHFVEKLGKETLRIKGFIHTTDGWVHIDAVGEQCNLNRIQEESGLKQGLVIIGKGNVPFKEKVKKLWVANMQDEPVLEDD